MNEVIESATSKERFSVSFPDDYLQVKQSQVDAGKFDVREFAWMVWNHALATAPRAVEPVKRKAVARNVYEPHPLMITSGQFWRCDHGLTGFDGNLNFVGCADCHAALPTPENTP